MTVSHVVLLGPMASGKTTLGRSLAELLAADFIDSDMSIAASTGVNAAEIASTAGVTQLHRIEKEVLSTALAASSLSVVAAAASVVDDERIREELGDHLCLWVEADAATLLERLGSAPHRRSLSEREADDLNHTRRRKAAHLVIGRVDTTDLNVQECTALAMGIITPLLPDRPERRP